MGKLAISGGKKIRNKPFHKWPHFNKSEERALISVLKSGNWGGFPSPNKKASEFAKKFAKFQDAKYGICAANGTVTLAVALSAAGIGAGDEVIVTPYTFVATAGCCIMVNAIPIFVDISPDTYCIDADKIEEKITEKTKAIIPVHLGSSMADMDKIMEIAKKYNLIVIEDCAHAHGMKWRKKGAGSIGDFGSFSFQSSKLMTAGEGGIIITSNKEFEEKCQSLVNCGRKEKGYDSYEGRLFGWNYRLTEFQGAILIEQLRRFPKQIKIREKNILYLEKKLKEIQGISLLKKDERITQRSGYMFIFKYHKEYFKDVSRDTFVKALNSEGIISYGAFYVPNYKNPLFPFTSSEHPLSCSHYGKKIDYREVSCPEAEKAAYYESVWLPHWIFLGDKKDVDDVLRAIEKIKENIDELIPKFFTKNFGRL